MDLESHNPGPQVTDTDLRRLAIHTVQWRNGVRSQRRDRMHLEKLDLVAVTKSCNKRSIVSIYMLFLHKSINYPLRGSVVPFS